MDENLNDPEKSRGDELIPQNPKWPFVAKIIIGCLIILVIVLIIVIILISLSKSENKDKEDNEDKEREILEKAGYFEIWNNLYGIKMSNLSYVKNDLIINSFKKGGDNYNETIGEINEGKDYPKMKEIIIHYIFLILPHLKKINIMEYYYLYMEVHGLMELKKILNFYVQDIQKWDI